MANTGMMMRPINHVGEHAWWFVALGVVFIIAGLFFLAMPLFGSLFVAGVVGWVFILMGIAQLVHAWQTREWGGVLWQAIIGAVFVLGGLSMIFDPISAALTLTLLLGIVFVVKGVMQIVLGVNYRPHAGWGWIVGAGALSVIVGLMVIFSWPLSGAWVLGTLAGISLIFSGWSYIAIGTATRRLAMM